LPAKSDSVNSLIACGWSPRGLYLLTSSKGIEHESNTVMAIRNLATSYPTGRAHQKTLAAKGIFVQSQSLPDGLSDKLHRN
jgi:hypothetical protein